MVDDQPESTDSPESFPAYRTAVADRLERTAERETDGPYEPTWDSLETHPAAPEWFRDAKFGIYAHWGPYAVPAYESEWYPRYMYNPDHECHDFHAATYGEPADFPYQRFVPSFTAERFDAGAWADLFVAAGARFAGPCVEHHDGWSNWDSAFTPWNAADRGPGTDLVGELEAAIRDRGLRFVASFHHTRTRTHYEYAYDHAPKVLEGYPDRVMYGNVPEALFFDQWLGKLDEVIEAYHPDLIWHDATLPTVPEGYHRRYLASYFNQAAADDRSVVVSAKKDELPRSVAVKDFERGRPAELVDRPWLTDDSILADSWGYIENAELQSARSIIHELVDIVSKNGCLLLNCGPRADGVIQTGQREVLEAIGDWLDTNGPAIYGTRPWETFGEGPTRLSEGGAFVDEVTYTAEDIRYTRSKDGETLYAIVLGWPDGGSMTFDSIEVGDGSGMVRFLGTGGEVGYEVTTGNRLRLNLPDIEPRERPCDHAFSFALSGFDLSYAG